MSIDWRSRCFSATKKKGSGEEFRPFGTLTDASWKKHVWWTNGCKREILMNQEYNMPPRMKPNMRLLVVPTHVTPAGFSQSTLSKDFDWSTVQEAVSSLSMQLFFAAPSDTLPLGSGVQLVQAIGLLDCWPGLNPLALDFSSRPSDGLFCAERLPLVEHYEQKGETSETFQFCSLTRTSRPSGFRRCLWH